MLDLFAGVAPRRGVELIGLVDQLDDAGMIDGRERPEHNRHFEPAEEFVHAFRRSKQSLAFGICGILLGAIPILGGKGDRFEITRVGEATHIMGGVFRQFRHGNHRQALADARPFDRIVIDKDQAVEPDVQARGNRLEVFRLIVPIRQEGGDIRPAKDHFGMIAKYGLRDLARRSWSRRRE